MTNEKKSLTELSSKFCNFQDFTRHFSSQSRPSMTLSRSSNFSQVFHFTIRRCVLVRASRVSLQVFDQLLELERNGVRITSTTSQLLLSLHRTAGHRSHRKASRHSRLIAVRHQEVHRVKAQSAKETPSSADSRQNVHQKSARCWDSTSVERQRYAGIVQVVEENEESTETRQRSVEK